MGKRLIVAMILLLWASAQAVPERFDDKVRDLFFSGFAGVSSDLDKGMALCEATLKEKPDDPDALVWHGAGAFFLGGQAFRRGDAAEGARLQAKGLAEMDHAVALQPWEAAARGPALMGAARAAPPAVSEAWLRTAMGDFAALETLSQSSGGRSEHDRGEILGALAEGWDRLGDHEKSRAYLERIVAELSPESNYSKRAKEWLVTGERPDRMTCLSCHKQGG